MFNLRAKILDEAAIMSPLQDTFPGDSISSNKYYF